MARKTPQFLTIHAKACWRERSAVAAQPLSHSIIRSAVLIPDRYAVPTWGSYHAQLAYQKSGRHGSAAFRVTATAVLICRGQAVVTVLPLEANGLSTVLTWLIFGFWLPD